MALPENNDIPLTSDEFVDDDIPMETSMGLPPATSEVAEGLYRQQAAVLKAEADETDVIEAFNNLDPEVPPKSQVATLAYERADRSKQQLTEYFNKNLGTDPEAIANNVTIYQELLQEEEAARNKPERQVADALASIGATDEEISSAEADLMLFNTLMEMTQDYSFFDKAVDFGKMMLPTAIIDNIQLTGSAFSAEEYMQNVVMGMKDLRRNDPEKFKKIFPALVETLKEDLPTGKAISVLSAIVGPRGEEELGAFSATDAVLDVVDIATLGAYTAVKIGTLTQKINAIRMAQRLHNTELAAGINAVAMVDGTGEARKALNIDETTAYSNSSPFNVSAIDPAYAAGISTETITRIQRVKEHQRKVSEIIRSEDGLLREDILTPAERAAAEERFTVEMQTQGVENFRMIKQGRDSTLFAYTSKDPNTGEDIAEIAEYALRYDDKTGIWRKPEQSSLVAFMASPTVHAKHGIEDVQSALRLDTTSAAIGIAFKKLQTEALAPILSKGKLKSFSPTARKELAELDVVLRAGDEWKGADNVRGKVYSPDELRGGVVDGIQLNDRQIEAYYNVRNLYDELWVIRNDETRRSLVAQGKQEIRIGGTPAIGKAFDRQGAVGVINSSGQVRVYDSIADEVVTIRGEDLGNYYDEGAVLSKLDSTIAPIEGSEELFDLVITSSRTVDALPNKVLHFRPGYVPKVNKDSYWFVKQRGTITVNGVTKTDQILKTERMFTTRTEAERWMASQGRTDLVALPDRALEQQVLGSSQVGAGGGLYTGPRASEDIPFGINGGPAERLNTYEALAQNLGSLENYVSRNHWRMAMQQKWINSAKAAGFENIDRFEKALIPEGDSRGAALRTMYDQIEGWSGFPTVGEQRWDGFLSGVQEWSLNSRFIPEGVGRTIVRGANYLRRRENDPVAFARAAAFHSLLGAFNPVQTWVQAQGVSISFSLSNEPMKAFRLQMALSTGQHLTSDPKALGIVAKALAVNPDELTQLITMWKKTGLQESVGNTADLAAAARGFGVGRTAAREVLDKGLFFYRAGELFNRRTAFIVAAERTKRRVGSYNFTDAQLRETLTDANNMMLNLSKANKAAWQKGVLAIPTQFLQVQAKFLEEVVGLGGRSFTIRERGRILAGQLALYGAAGIPLGSLGVRWAQETMGFTQAEIEDLPQPVVDAINGGLWEVYAHQWLGADVDLANRGAISEGMTQFTLDLMFSEATIGEKVIGAFGQVPSRTYQAWKTIKPMVLNKSEEPISVHELLRGANSILSITSTWTNLQKGMFMQRYDELLDSKGNLAVADEFDPRTEIMVMMGFQPSEMGRIYDREALVRSRKEFRKQISDMVIDHYWNYVQALKGVENEEDREQIIANYSAGTQAILASLRNEEEIDKVRESVNKRLETLEDRKSRSIRAYLEEFSDSQVLSLGSYVESARARGLITNDLEKVEDE